MGLWRADPGDVGGIWAACIQPATIHRGQGLWVCGCRVFRVGGGRVMAVAGRRQVGRQAGKQAGRRAGGRVGGQAGRKQAGRQ